MSSTNLDSSKVLVKRLANLLGQENGAEILTTMQLLLQPYKQKALSAPPPKAVNEPSERIGIWRLDPQDGIYRRTTQEKSLGFVGPGRRPDVRFWADVEHFPLKKTAGRRRVLLIGESVARAYLYDPEVTLAKVIDEYIDGSESGPFEIIDLARSAINANQIIQLMQDADCLDPDIIVFFAGNNWMDSYEYTQADWQEIIESFERGYDCTRDIFENRILPRASERVMAQLDRIGKNAKKIVIIPEFNVAGWRNDLETGLPIAKYDQVEKLVLLPQTLNRALEAQDWSTLFSACDELEKQTQKKSYLPFYFRGRAFLKQGKHAEALAQLNLAKDAPLGMQMSSAPRCPTVVQETLRATSAKYRMDVIDLPKILRGPSGSHVPGFDLFLDYCHLTLRGLHLLGKEIAELVLQQSNLPDRYSDKKDVGATYFLAAIHNSHFGQEKATIQAQIAKSLALDPGMRELLVNYLEFQSSVSPRWLHRSFEKVSGSKVFEKYFCLNQPDGWDKFADYQIYDAVIELIAKDDAEKAKYEALVLEAAEKAGGADVNLLADRFCAKIFRQTSLFRQRAFYQAQLKESIFFLPLTEPSALEFSLQVRIPPVNQINGSSELSIEVNGKTIGKAELSKHWQVLQLVAPREVTFRGVNRIKLVWPNNYPEWEPFFKSALKRLYLQSWPNILPTFGDVFRFQAKKVKASHVG